MVNSIEQVNHMLDLGANGVECDVQFVSDGTPVHVFHGIPCDCFRDCQKWTPIEQYIQHIRELTSPESYKYNERFVLLVLDLKTENLAPDKKLLAGENLFDLLLEHLFSNGQVLTKINVLLSLQKVNDEPIMDGFMKQMLGKRLTHLNKHIGWDVSANEPLDKIGTMYTKRLTRANVWQSDGITNCLSFMNPVERLRAVIKLRDQFRAPYMSKVYHWTIDLHFSIRSTLRLGVDGLITNYPNRVQAIINEDEFHRNMTLATHADNPWVRYGHENKLTDIKSHLDRLSLIYDLLKLSIITNP